VRVLNLVLVLSVASGISVPAQTLSTMDAAQHVGQHATVCGEIAGEHTAESSRGTPTFINLDKPYPSQVFTILIWGENKPSVGSFPTSGRVCATGIITEYRGAPEIVVRDAQSWYVPK
jgi:DNA/RNA endonuclease YhcR with UshA esterase domain